MKNLDGSVVRLEPLAMGHLEGLCQIGLDAALWTVGIEQLLSRDDMAAYIARALAARDAGTVEPYAVVHKPSGRLAGSTRFMNIEVAHKRLEIGSTWYGVEFQRTTVNTEAKLLLLTRGFETLQVNRVELKTDVMNERSRAAILRLGACEEGILRQHMVTSRGRVRDTVYFSIVRSEWPSVKARLEGFLRPR